MYSGLDTDLREYEELCEHFGMGVAYNPWMPLEEVARISQTSWFGILSKVTTLPRYCYVCAIYTEQCSP